MTSATVMIIDFGEAFLLDCSRIGFGLGVPIMSFPPEVCFGQPASASSDVWELGCLLFEISCGNPLFPLLFFPTFEMLVRHIVDRVGLLPCRWKGHFDADSYGYREDGQILSSPDGEPFWFEAAEGHEEARHTVRGLFAEAQSESELTDEQQEFLASPIQDMLAREPEERLSAHDALLRLESTAPLFSGDVAEKAKARRPRSSRYGDEPSPPSSPEPNSDSDSP
ncbi:unnamed protein product [Discula destructiva]